jgi:hypothetical protein
MDKLNKFYNDSSWKTMKSVNEQIKIIKGVAKEHALKATIKIKKEGIWYVVYVKLNRNK